MYSKIKLQLSVNSGEAVMTPILSFNHYLAHIELFEFTTFKTTDINFSCDEPAFFMYVMLQNNSCSLCYIREGNCTQPVSGGKHRILMIRFRLEWLIYKLQRMKPLNSFSVTHHNYDSNYIRFPTFNIANTIFKSFSKMAAAPDESKKDDEGYTFINGCINKYYNRLISKNNTRIFHLGKAAKVRSFINENFNTSIAGDVPKLAEKFMLSERNLARVAKLAFGMPLHEQVIKLRINASLQQLTATDKPIYEIAQQTGYNDPHYFSKAFKKHFGVSPKCIKRPRPQMTIAEIQG